MQIRCMVGDEHLLDVRDASGMLRNVLHLMPRHQHRDVATNCMSSRDRVQCRRAERAFRMFCDYENGHQITFASVFNLSTSCATDSTLTPALRSAGGSTRSVLSVVSMGVPSVLAASVSNGFFFAFMILGSVV